MKKRRSRQLSLNFGLDTKISRRSPANKQKIQYPKWWIWTPRDNGVTGYFNSKEEAYRYANANFDVSFKIVPLNTIDKNKAASALRAKKMPIERIKYSEVSRTRMKHRKIEGNKNGMHY